MLIGGLFGADLELLYSNRKRESFQLRCDPKNRYNRKILTNNARTATVYAFQHGMRLKEDEEVLIPEYNCISVVNALEVANVKFRAYKIRNGFEVDTEDLESKITEKTKAIYVISYFGAPQPLHIVETLKSIAARYDLYIMEDLTQTLLTIDEGRIGFGDYIVASVRKWYPVTDGGLVAARNDRYFEEIKIPTEPDLSVAQQWKLTFARFCYNTGSMTNMELYHQLEKKANASRYIDFSPRAMTDDSKIILEKSDHCMNMERRRENYSYIYKRLENFSDIEILSEQPDKSGKHIPFGLVIYIENRDELYRFLLERQVIGEIQWVLPQGYYDISDWADDISKHSLMLQIDQRYTSEEMKITADLIDEFLKK